MSGNKDIKRAVTDKGGCRVDLALVEKFVKLSSDQLNTEVKELSAEACEYLLKCEWPEGEQEIELAVKRACILSQGDKLDIEDFDLKYRQARSIGRFVESKLKGFMRNIKRFEDFNLYEMVIPEVEKSLIMMVLKETNGNQIRASRLLGINRNTLRTKIRKLGIKVK